MAIARRQELDRPHPEIAQDLCPEADIAPGLLAPAGGARALRRGDARGALAKIDEHAAALPGEAVIDGLERLAAAEQVFEEILPVEPDRNVAAVADIAEDDRQMLHRIERRWVGDHLRRTGRRTRRKAGTRRDQAPGRW